MLVLLMLRFVGCAAARGRLPVRGAGVHVRAGSGGSHAPRAGPDGPLAPPPAPAGRAYLPFQLEAIDFILSRRRVIVADEMGLGKTVTAIGAMNALAHASLLRKVLVICPKSLVLTWEAELKRWLVRPTQILVGLPRVDDPPDLDESAVVILNYEMVPKHKPQLCAVEWDMLVCDEAHLLKNPKTLRTTAVLGQLIPDGRKQPVYPLPPSERPINPPYKLFLTGSPLLNRPIELFPLIAAVDPHGECVPAVLSYKTFAQRYCDAHLVPIPGQRAMRWDITGSSNEHELRQLLSALMLRRLKADVLTSLPPKLFQLLPLESKAVRAAEDKALLAILDSASAEFAGAAGLADDDGDAPRAAAAAGAPRTGAAGGATGAARDADEGASGETAALTSLSWLGLARAMNVRSEALRQATSSLPSTRLIPAKALSRIMTARRETALAKVDAALEHIRTIIDADTDAGAGATGAQPDGTNGAPAAPRKLVVFAHHTEVIGKLLDGLGERAVSLTGADSTDARARAVSRFQTDPGVQVFVGSILAAGVGVTLTAASHVLFVELDWSPAHMAQAEDRCHRIGQRSCVLVTYLVFRGTLDERLAQMLIEKQATIDRIVPASVPAATPATAALQTGARTKAMGSPRLEARVGGMGESAALRADAAADAAAQTAAQHGGAAASGSVGAQLAMASDAGGNALGSPVLVDELASNVAETAAAGAGAGDAEAPAPAAPPARKRSARASKAAAQQFTSAADAQDEHSTGTRPARSAAESPARSAKDAQPTADASSAPVRVRGRPRGPAAAAGASATSAAGATAGSTIKTELVASEQPLHAEAWADVHKLLTDADDDELAPSAQLRPPSASVRRRGKAESR